MGHEKLRAIDKFEFLWMSHNGPMPLIKEYRFSLKRKWRIDYYSPVAKIAIEIEGGIWTRGRHTHPAGFMNDIEKYNALSYEGILLFRIPAHQITGKWILPIIETARRRSS